MLLLATLGVAAGLITTLSGFGGGVFLVTSLAVIWDPLTALTTTSLALLMGNAQRLFLFRRHFLASYSVPVIAGAIPGALGGAFLAAQTPDWILQAAIVVITFGAAARAFHRTEWSMRRRHLAPAAAGIGFLSATTGGGGFLMGPLLLSAGATGGLYIATGASAGVAIHIFRITGYSTSGLLDLSMFGQALLLGLTIMAGNLVGRSLRGKLSPRQITWIQYAAPVVCGALALAGL